MSFKGFETDPPPNGGGGGGRPPLNDPLARQSSIYSLTFDEFHSTVGGSLGKDFGSMNMDELLKNIWSAEEVQSMASVGAPSIAAAQIGGPIPATPIQRQGSLTLPRTLSHKTVDEVWRDVSKGGNGVVGSNLGQAQRQPTLGEITLEEFLVRAGVVREDNTPQFAPKPQNGTSYFGNNNSDLGIVPGLMSSNANLNPNPNPNPIPIQSSNLPLNVNGLRSSNQQLGVARTPPHHHHLHHPQQQQVFPKQLAYGAPQLSSPHGGGGGVMGMVGLGAMTGSPANQISSDGVKSNGDTSSVSPVPFVFNGGGMRGRKSGGAVEKVVERRQRRMIKNRESAARSRARKQAYTMELEAEVAKLKEEKEELLRKQDEMIEIQKNQQMEMMNMQKTGKKRCLRRTQTGPW